MRWSALWFLLGAGTTLAAPFVVSDPLDSRATHCGFAVDGGARADVPVALSGANKICKVDLSALAVGTHVLNATAVAVDATWGRLESPPSANFTFAVPSVPSAPGGLRLIP